ncbi:MAG: HAMP domain-containing histidine kinase [Burkholderiales bacterium]|nr:HAMP domain-containing histidine kinase [Anaerolineae bacterium]
MASITLTDAVLTISIVAHVILLVFARLRGRQARAGLLWLSLAIVFSLLAAAAHLLPPAETFLIANKLERGFLAALALVAMLVCFGAVVVSDVAKPRMSRIWLVVGILTFVAVIAAAMLTDPVTVGQPEWLVTAFVTNNVSALVALGALAILIVTLLGITFYVFYAAPLPEVANRALFWVLDTAVVLVGLVLSLSGTSLLTLPGTLILLLGLAGATYALASYRVFHVRGWVTLALRMMLAIPFAAAVIFVALTVADRAFIDEPATTSVLAAISLIAATIYVIVRQLAQPLVIRLTAAPSTDAGQATKEYSQQVSKAVELEQLAQTTTDTLNRVMRVRRSSLLLVDQMSGARDVVELLPQAVANSDVSDGRGQLSTFSPVYRQLAIVQAPLSQFDIEFNPDFAGIADEERAYFQGLGMSAYAPIIAENSLIGVLASGPKVSDAPFYTSDLELLATIASQTSVALRNARLVTDLRRLNESMKKLNVNLEDTNEQMEKLDSVKTDFVTIASHELRTPLAQVRGYIDIMDALNEQGMLDHDQITGMVGNLRKASERMEELIAAMLDVSQLDVDAMDLRFTQAAPESVLRMAIEPLTDAIKQRKLTLSARGLRGLPPIQADMQRLVQAFRNVVLNAIKFTPDGGRIEITASLQAAAKPGERDHILVAIADTGVGIDRENLDLVFKKFFRAYDPGLHSTGTYKFLGAGPGLGLTIAKGVIEGHGGKIWVESDGHNMESFPGTTFYVILPIIPPEGARRVSPFDKQLGQSNGPTPDGLATTMTTGTVVPRS